MREYIAFDRMRWKNRLTATLAKYEASGSELQ
jgi:hypothetical protein